MSRCLHSDLGVLVPGAAMVAAVALLAPLEPAEVHRHLRRLERAVELHHPSLPLQLGLQSPLPPRHRDGVGALLELQLG